MLVVHCTQYTTTIVDHAGSTLYSVHNYYCRSCWQYPVLPEPDGEGTQQPCQQDQGNHQFIRITRKKHD